MAKKGIPNADPGKFEGQTTITSVKFGSQCYFVGKHAFQKCTSLSEINDDNVLESIGSNAFAQTNLKSANFSKLNELYDGAFNSCRNLSHVSIPNCENIPQNAFCGCINLSDINFDNCYTIGDMAFTSCERLNKVNLKKCVSIGASAFSGCNNITQVELFNCKQIGSNAFANCKNLTNVYINNESDIFCSLMSEYVFCTHDISSPSICSINSNITFHFRADVLDIYKSATNWSHYSKYMTKISQPNQIIYKTNDNNIIEVNSDESNPIKFNSYFANYGVIEFENNVKSLNDQMFKNATTLTSINVPSECEIIGSNTFEGCENLNNITLPIKLKSIGEYAFKGCEAFKTFEIPETTNEIGEGSFAGCKNIERFEGSGKFITYGGKAVLNDRTLICVLPKDDSDTEGRIYKISDLGSGINRLGKSCFCGCENLRRVDIKSGVTSIGDFAFEGCKNIREIHFDGTVPPTIGEDIFKDININNLKIFVPESSLEAYHEAWALSGYTFYIYPKAEDTSIIYYGDEPISDSHQTINKIAVNGKYYKLTSSSTTVSSQFSQSSITKIILGESFTQISTNAFKDCKKLEYVYIPDNISLFDSECFYGCRYLKMIHIPYNSYINGCRLGIDLFYNCSSLKEFITYRKGYVSEDNRCYIENNVLKLFAHGVLSDEEKAYIIPDGIIEINRSAFRNSNIESITLNSSTKTIGYYAFENCKNLQAIYNWDNVNVICGHAFSECSNLGEISLPSKLTKIGENGFTNCGQMYINNNLPNSVEIIGNNAFEKCTKFKCIDDKPLNLTNIKYIGTAAFSECKALTNIDINRNIKSINDRAFQYCENLENLNLIECTELTYIGSNAFEGCENYTGYLEIPTNVTSIGDCCFQNSGIEEVSTNYKINTIPEYAFSGCKNLTHINISSNIKTISNYAFNECENLCTDTGKLELHDFITSIGDRAFYNCKNILETTLPRVTSLGDYCFKTNNVNTNIFIPKGLIPPQFSTDESNPFGPADDTYPKLYVHSSDIEIYKEDKYWKKYKDRFIKYITDINVKIDLNDAYIDKDILSHKSFKVTNVGSVDTNDYIFLYNSAWRCYNRMGISFKTHLENGRPLVSFQVDVSEMERFLNNRDETKYSTLNISIPMKTKNNNKKFRIIVSIKSFGSNILSQDGVTHTPEDVMLSMGTDTEHYGYSYDWTNCITTSVEKTSKELYLMGYTINQNEYESQKITVPKVYGNGDYQIIPSKLYITGNDNGDCFKVSVYLYRSSSSSYFWTSVKDDELYYKTVFSLLGCLSSDLINSNLDALDFENALELMGMTSLSSDRGVRIKISYVY